MRAGEIVVLLRAGGDLRVYERALALRGVRTLAAVGAFWEHQQVADLLAYLRALANPLDELALYGVLASPLVGLSSDALALLAQGAHASAAAGSGEARERRAPAGSALDAGDAEALASVLRGAGRRARRRAAVLALGADRAGGARALLPRARARPRLGRAADGEHPQAAAPRTPFRGGRGP